MPDEGAMASIAALCDREQPRAVWKLEEALALVRQIQPQFQHIHWNVVLGGSVLYKGESAKDLDLVVFPYDTSRCKDDRLYELLRWYGWRRTHTAKQTEAYRLEQGSKDEKHVEVWRTRDDRRVDLIMLL